MKGADNESRQQFLGWLDNIIAQNGREITTEQNNWTSDEDGRVSSASKKFKARK